MAKKISNLAGISRRQRKKNDDIRLELNQMDTQHWYKRYRDAGYSGSVM